LGHDGRNDGSPGDEEPDWANWRVVGTARMLVATFSDGVEAVLDGELDAANGGAVADLLLDACAGTRPHLIVDVERLEVLDSAGLQALVQVLRRVRAGGGELVIRHPTRIVRRVLDISGLPTLPGATVS
jgi:anti-sigma B factor antagonist